MSDANRIVTPNAMSAADWEALGPMGRVADAADVIFDNAEVGTDYAGDDERPRPEREYIPHVFVTSIRHPLANPRRTGDMSEYEAGHALHAHYSRTLAKGDQKAVQLLVELARTGNKLINDGLDHAARSDAELRTEIIDTRAARGDAAKDLAEEVASNSVRRGGGSREFVVIAPTTSEAKIIRGMIDYALTVMPPDTEISSQKFIHKPEELPAWTEMKKALDAVRPELWGLGREDGKKSIALIVSEGLEDVAAEWVAKKLGKSFSVTPGHAQYIADPNGGPSRNALWGALMAKDGNNHWRNKVERPVGVKGAAAIHAFNENAIKAADRTVVFWNGDVQDQAFVAMAHAARRGRLEAVFDSAGRQADPKIFHALAEEAMETHMSKAEWARMRNVGVFDIVASTPEGRLALSLIRTSNAAMSAVAIENLARTELTINEIAAMASDPQGREELFRKHKIPAQIMDALADTRVMSNARDAFQRILGHCKDHGVTIVGPEHYPAGLRRSKANMPPVMFLKGGSPEQLRDLKNTVAIMGDNDMLAPMAQKASELMVALDRPELTLVQVERMGAPEYIPNNPSLLILASGHGHYGSRTKLAWDAQKDGSEVAVAKSGTYAMVPSKDGRQMALNYTPKGGETIELAKIRLPEKPVVTVFDKTEEMDEETQSKMRAYKNALESLKDRAGTHETFRLSKSVRDFREGIVAQGGMILSRYAPVESNSLYSFATGQREGSETHRSAATEAATIELTARLADVTVLNQVSAQSPLCGAIAVAAETGRRPLVIQPDPQIVNFDEISGNLALTRTTGKELPMHINLPGQRGMAVEKAFPRQRVGISTGPNMEIAAEKIAEQLTAPTAERVFGKKTKETAEAAR